MQQPGRKTLQRTPLYTNNVLQSFANGDQRSKLVYTSLIFVDV